MAKRPEAESDNSRVVIPANAGSSYPMAVSWIPAFAGMTDPLFCSAGIAWVALIPQQFARRDDGTVPASVAFLLLREKVPVGRMRAWIVSLQ
jgi:hypothetical protein